MQWLRVLLFLVFLFTTGCDSGNGIPDNNTTADDNNRATDDAGPSERYALMAWNDLGMHCMDGKDFSVFSILPPYNNLKAQLILKEETRQKHVVSGVEVTYEAAQSLSGSINTTSTSKTDFWDYAAALFGLTLEDDTGLTGNKTPGMSPYPMSYNAQYGWWEADGIPILNYDDNGVKNYYPMVKVVAKDLEGNELASIKTVLPVSDEMDCAKCHASNTNFEAMPSGGWVDDPDSSKDYKLNILKLHDDRDAIGLYLSDLEEAGYRYQASLYETARQGTPILCAACHGSNALGTEGYNGIKSLTEAIHTRHASVSVPGETTILGADENRAACYACHPGATTQCLRGAMGKALSPDGTQKMQCQSCHGGMTAVGDSGRTGWFEEPNCQACHQDGERFTQAVVDDAGTLREALDLTFATQNDTPVHASSLYRFSRGHGELQCAACHGSPHAVYPSSHEEDNLQSIALQGHAGTVAECTACHQQVPFTETDGPHGMHTVGQSWVDGHEDIAEYGVRQCKKCHGEDYRGTVLSRASDARTFETFWGRRTFEAGQTIGCYECHDGPTGH